MKSSYDPDEAPDPKEWLSIDEELRSLLVEEYHQKAGIKLPNVRLHSVFHVVVENQTALGDETPVQRTLTRLMEEGLDRHDAVHAVGAILSKHMYNLLKENADSGNNNPTYYQDLERLTAKSWRRGDWTK
ncbi:MAG: DUF1841 family protein [Gemmatimonadota bacterium]|nr:MAG: DUF1841 family protein [Gemmatimonadota bacterium]